MMVLVQRHNPDSIASSPHGASLEDSHLEWFCGLLHVRSHPDGNVMFCSVVVLFKCSTTIDSRIFDHITSVDNCTLNKMTWTDWQTTTSEQRKTDRFVVKDKAYSLITVDEVVSLFPLILYLMHVSVHHTLVYLFRVT